MCLELVILLCVIQPRLLSVKCLAVERSSMHVLKGKVHKMIALCLTVVYLLTENIFPFRPAQRCDLSQSCPTQHCVGKNTLGCLLLML